MMSSTGKSPQRFQVFFSTMKLMTEADDCNCLFSQAKILKATVHKEAIVMHQKRFSWQQWLAVTSSKLIPLMLLLVSLFFLMEVKFD